MIATGDPKRLLAECENPTVKNFLTRGEAHAKQHPGDTGAVFPGLTTEPEEDHARRVEMQMKQQGENS